MSSCNCTAAITAGSGCIHCDRLSTQQLTQGQ
jgi:hypothetical protein